MLIILLFAFASGFMTVLSPCVLPVLPAILAAGATHARARSIGIVLGLILSFAFFTLAIGAIVKSTGISADALRYLAILIIGVFGLALLFPHIGEVFARKTSAIADAGAAVQKRFHEHEGFWGGCILGAALGLIWTPCAGPILASVIAIAATNAITWQIILITAAYALGSGIPMLLLMFGSKWILDSSRWLTRHTEKMRQGFGLLMILTAIALYFHAEVPLQQWTLQYLPWVDIEKNDRLTRELEKLRTPSGQSGAIEEMPPFVGTSSWINSEPLSPEKLKGKVVLVDFWTYSCINCIRTFPYLKEWDKKYRDLGLVIVGVHTPEFEFEKNPQNVKEAVQRFDIKYPVALDNEYLTWSAYHNLYWPAHYLFDQQGELKEKHFGEGAYLETENEIRRLLGLKTIAGKEEQKIVRRLTPETYLGYRRAENYVQEERIHPNSIFDYQFHDDVPTDRVALNGLWKVGEESLQSEGDGAELKINFLAARVYLVMSSNQKAFVKVLLDGQPLPKEYYTADMDQEGRVIVQEPRKYDLINLHMHYGRHTLTLIMPKGVQNFAFTFGDEP